MSDTLFLLFLLVILPAIWIAIFIVRRGSGNSSKKDRRREAAIKTLNFGKFEQDVIDRQVEVGMTDAMVLAAWGKPTSMHQQKKTKKSTEMVLVYGNPNKESEANFIRLRNGIVAETKINQPHQVTRRPIRPGLVLIAILFMVWGVLFCVLSNNLEQGI